MRTCGGAYAAQNDLRIFDQPALIRYVPDLFLSLPWSSEAIRIP